MESNKKTILIFSDWYEPGFKGGGPIRSVVNFCKSMSDVFNIYVFTGDRDFGDTAPYKDIKTDHWIKRDEANVFYASIKSLNWKTILRLIKELDPGYIYLNNMYSRYFTIYPLLMKRLGLVSAKVVLAPRGMLHEGAMQYKERKKRFFLGILNALRIPQKIDGHATDEQEASDIRLNLPGIKSITIIANYAVYVSDSFISTLKQFKQVKLIYISRISPKKNLLFLLNALKETESDIDCQLIIRGGVEEESYWQECKEIIKEIPSNVSVDFKGPTLHEEVNELLQNNHLFVLPTFGENFGHAIFESLAIGRPVLISDKTPWRNLSVHKAGWDLPLNNSRAFITVIKQVAYMDSHEFELWCKGAWSFAKAYQENSTMKEKYIALFS